MKRICLFAAILLAFTVSSKASVLIQIGTSGWKNQNNVAANNMNWGIVVSTNSASMSGGAATQLAAALLNFSLPTPPGENLASTPIQIGTSEYYYISGQTLTRSGSPPTFPAGFMDQVLFDFTGPVGAGDAYGLLWFPSTATTQGSSFGFQNVNQTLPNNGSTITVPAQTPGFASFTIVPEPSRALLLLGGVIGLAVRRRRC